MALAGVIQQQQPRPNAMGQALIQGAENIGGSMFKAAQIKNQQDMQLATLAMQFLPGLANNPEALARFTASKDFSRIHGALQRVGLGSLVSFDPGSNAYKINMNPTARSVDDMLSEDIRTMAAQGRTTGGNPLPEGVQAKRRYALSVRAKRAGTPDYYSKAYQGALGKAEVDKQYPDPLDTANATKLNADAEESKAEAEKKRAQAAFQRSLIGA